MRRCPPRAWRRARRAAPEQHRNGEQAALPALRRDVTSVALSLRRLELDHHGARVTPVRNRIGIGIALRTRIARPVGLIHHGENVVGHQRDDRHVPYGELDELAAELEALWIVKADGADLLDALVELRRGPALPIARRLRLAGRRHELRMPAVEKKRQVRVPAPGLDAPRYQGVEVAAGAAVDQR